MAVYTTIDDPAQYFQTVTYSGNGSNDHTITGVGFNADFVWNKLRNGTDDHRLFNQVAGIDKYLESSNTDTEVTDAILTTNSDGYVLTNAGEVNSGSGTYVGWNWKANGSGSSNTDGSINTTATSANTTAGFSIVTWTGDEGSSATLGQGLGAVPKMIITKGRTYASSWATFHASMGATKWFQMCETDAVATASTIWNDTEPTSTLFTVGSSNQVNDAYNYLAYVFAEKQGFSKFGSYVGNGNADGPFVYTGFRPAFILYKNTARAISWLIHDNKRLGYNVNNDEQHPDTDAADGTDDRADILSNGFKIREDSALMNTDGETVIYAAFAEAPFCNSSGVPCNAR